MFFIVSELVLLNVNDPDNYGYFAMIPDTFSYNFGGNVFA